MPADPRIALSAGAHAVLSCAALWLIGSASAPPWLRLPAVLVAAAVLLPWLPVLITGRLRRLTPLALLLVVAIGAGIVEVLATAASTAAIVLLGAAMLEFAALFTLARDRRARTSSE